MIIVFLRSTHMSLKPPNPGRRFVHDLTPALSPLRAIVPHSHSCPLFHHGRPHNIIRVLLVDLLPRDATS